MAKAKVKLFPYIQLDRDGKFVSCRVETWRYVDKNDCPDGAISKETGIITVYLPPIEIEVEHPTDVREQALRILRFHRDKLTAEHVKVLTTWQWTEGMLLGLAAPEVLDNDNIVRHPDRNYEGEVEEAEVKAPRDTMQQFGDDNHDDDIPF